MNLGHLLLGLTSVVLKKSFKPTSAQSSGDQEEDDLITLLATLFSFRDLLLFLENLDWKDIGLNLSYLVACGMSLVSSWCSWLFLLGVPIIQGHHKNARRAVSGMGHWVKELDTTAVDLTRVHSHGGTS